MRPSERPINFAVIGPGRMGLRYAEVLRRECDVRLVAVCGHSEAATKTRAAPLGVPLYFDNQFDRMFEEHPEIDAVVIATAEWAHLEPALAAAARGKHILIEKPLAASLVEAERIASAIKAGSSRVVVCHTCRFDQRYIVGRKTLEAGDLGPMGYMYSRRIGDRVAAARVRGRFPLAYWLTCHDVDLMRWFAKSEAIEVTAFGSGGDLDGDFLHVELAFANGARGMIENSWFCRPLEGNHHSRFDVECADGRIEIDVSTPPVKSYHRDVTGPVHPDLFDYVDVHGSLVGATPNLVRHFLDVVHGKADPAASIDDGLAAVRVCDAVDRSLQERRTIRMGGR